MVATGNAVQCVEFGQGPLSILLDTPFVTARFGKTLDYLKSDCYLCKSPANSP